MNSKFAVTLFSALLYGQGLLGFAALAAVLMKDRAPETHVTKIVRTTTPGPIAL